MTAPGQFVFDPNRCTGCEACVLACWMENRAQQTQPWRRVYSFNGPKHPGLPVFQLSLACHHCDHPACLEQCPAGAYARDAATGAVVLDSGRCMGCRYCTWVCPHDAPRYAGALGTVEKCTFCQSRQAAGLEPACVARCPVAALGFEPRDPAGRGALPRGFPESALGPAIRIAAPQRPGPELTAPPEPAALGRHWGSLLRIPESKITLRGEWTLVVFTATLAVLVAVLAAHAAATPLRASWPLQGGFLGAGLAALALSTSHLGRPFRAWRALTNLRHSWVSREIALVSAFLGLAGLQLLWFPAHRPLAWAAVAVGFLALWAVDRVYQVALHTGALNFHSAQALFTGLYLAGILAGSVPLALAAGALKAVLYGHRKLHFRRQGRAGTPLLSLLRLALGFAGPALAFGTGLGALSAVLGELLDRCEFYRELELPTPARALAQALARIHPA